jgi:hypothetical protein
VTVLTERLLKTEKKNVVLEAFWNVYRLAITLPVKVCRSAARLVLNWEQLDHGFKITQGPLSPH